MHFANNTYRIMSNIGSTPIKAPPSTYLIFFPIPIVHVLEHYN